MRKMLKRSVIPTAIIALSVVLDQITKHLAVVHLMDSPKKTLIPYIINLTYHTNEGASFGILKDHRWVFMSFSVLAIVAMSYWLYRYGYKNILATISMSMILGGGIGNMIDRVIRKEVVDFLEFDFVRFAIFNVADAFITVGTVIFIIYIVFFEKNKKSEPVDGDITDSTGESGQQA